MISTEYVAHFLGVDSEDEDERKLIEGIIENSYIQIRIATNQDLRDNEEYKPIVDEIVCSMCYMSYYGNRDDAKHTQHLQNYIDKNLSSLQILLS